MLDFSHNQIRAADLREIVSNATRLVGRQPLEVGVAPVGVECPRSASLWLFGRPRLTVRPLVPLRPFDRRTFLALVLTSPHSNSEGGDGKCLGGSFVG